MPASIRIATFNVENLFDRAKLLNFDDPSIGDRELGRVAQLQRELKKPNYDKPRILTLYRSLKEYVAIVETRD